MKKVVSIQLLLKEIFFFSMNLSKDKNQFKVPEKVKNLTEKDEKCSLFPKTRFFNKVLYLPLAKQMPKNSTSKLRSVCSVSNEGQTEHFLEILFPSIFTKN